MNYSGYVLHNILQATFNFTENTVADRELQCLKPVDILISAFKSLVRYMKKSGDNNLLSKPLHQYVDGFQN